MELIIKIALAIIFGLAALTKFSGKTKDTFKKSGYSSSFMYAIAGAEVFLSIGLFTPYVLPATIGLLAIIVGAIITLTKQQVAPAKYGMAVLSFILLAGLLVSIVYPNLNLLVSNLR
jgi:hypothetical protein